MPDPTTLTALAKSAWTDKASMAVLSDRFLELGMRRRPTARSVTVPDEHAERDEALYHLECEVRMWILEYFGTRMIPPAALELRVTGKWPDVVFVVHRSGPPGSDTPRVEVVPGVFEQPRLLRA